MLGMHTLCCKFSIETTLGILKILNKQTNKCCVSFYKVKLKINLKMSEVVRIIYVLNFLAL